VAGNFTAVMWFASRQRAEAAPELVFDVMQGLGEAVTPLILGSGLLSIAWLLVALGVRRHDVA